MAIFSKLTNSFTCYELGHTWTPSCFRAWKDIAKVAYTEAFKLYFPIYVLAAIFQNKGKKYMFYKLLPEVLQSTAFLGTNGFAFIASFCLWRYISVYYYKYQVFWLGGPICFLSLSIERQNRRHLLSVYMANIAIETLYSMLKARHYVKPLPGGEIFLFSLASSILMYFHSTNQIHGFIKSIINFVMGDGNLSNLTVSSTSVPRESVVNRLILISRFSNSIKATCRIFVIGWVICALPLFMKSFKSLRKQPNAIFRVFQHKDNVRVAAFLASYVILFKSVRGCLQHLCRSRCNSATPTGWQSALAGFVAGLSMMWYRSSSIALYLASKAVEIIISKTCDAGFLPRFAYIDNFVYMIATSLLCHAAVLEPHNLRPAYWQFLLRLTQGRFAVMNRALLDELGTGASTIAPHFWPKYDLRFTRLAAGPQAAGLPPFPDFH